MGKDRKEKNHDLEYIIKITSIHIETSCNIGAEVLKNK